MVAPLGFRLSAVISFYARLDDDNFTYRGIADEDGGWAIRMCAACSSSKQNQGYGEWIKLSGRCVKCTKMAYFALVKRKGRGSAEGDPSADSK